MVQEVSNGDRFAVGGKIGKKFRERLVVAKFSVVDEQHDRHGGELLREGSQAEIGAGIYLRFRTKVAHTFGSRVNISSAISNQDSEAGLVRLDERAEYGLFHTLRGFSSLAPKPPAVEQGKKQCCSRDPKNSVQHAHLESAAGAYHPAERSSCSSSPEPSAERRARSRKMAGSFRLAAAPPMKRMSWQGPETVLTVLRLWLA